MEEFLISFVRLLMQIVTLLVIAKVILSYFMSPYHPVREAIDRLVEPMLAPIRRFVPPLGMLDFTPFVFIILVQVLGSLLINIIRAIF
jgi:YggT family protein